MVYGLLPSSLNMSASRALLLSSSPVPLASITCSTNQMTIVLGVWSMVILAHTISGSARAGELSSPTAFSFYSSPFCFSEVFRHCLGDCFHWHLLFCRRTDTSPRTWAPEALGFLCRLPQTRTTPRFSADLRTPEWQRACCCASLFLPCTACPATMLASTKHCRHTPGFSDTPLRSLPDGCESQ